MSDVKEKEKVASSVSKGPGVSAKPTIEVDVIATRDWIKGVDFTLRWEYPPGVWNSGPMVFAKGDTNREIEYRLDDQTDLSLEFEKTPDECIWVTADGKCPTKEPAKGSDKHQIKDKDRASAKKFKLKNANDQICNLHYALRFTGKPWTRPDGAQFGPEYLCDPEYRNTGGGASNV